MPDLLSKLEREQLERLEGEIERWQTALNEDLETTAASSGTPEHPIDPAYAERFVETARRLSSQVHKEVPPDIDPEALAEIRGHIIDGLQALNELDEKRPLDSVDTFLVHAESVRHIVRDALDGQPDGDESSGKELLEGLSQQLPGITRKQLGELIGVGERQIQRLAKDEDRPPSRRLQLVARLAALLARAWTPAGVVAWFYRQREDLDGRSPIDVLDDPDYERALMLAARRGRAQHGS
jgi:transcriptional regulator with XRE-family HTH domain